MDNEKIESLRKLINKNIVEIRKSKNISPSELARRIGWSRQRIYDIEKSTNMIQISTLIQIADGLDVSILDLFNDSKEKGIKTSLLTKLKSLDQSEQEFVEKFIEDLIEFSNKN